MKIEVLYFEGCPNHKLAVARIEELLREEGISALYRGVSLTALRQATNQGQPLLALPTIAPNLTWGCRRELYGIPGN